MFYSLGSGWILQWLDRWLINPILHLVHSYGSNKAFRRLQALLEKPHADSILGSGQEEHISAGLMSRPLVEAPSVSRPTCASRPGGHERVQYPLSCFRCAGNECGMAPWRSGTHQGPGPFPGLAPTGKFAAVQHIHIFRITNGKIVEHWAVRDDLSFLQQVGLFPGPGQAS